MTQTQNCHKFTAFPGNMLGKSSIVEAPL